MSTRTGFAFAALLVSLSGCSSDDEAPPAGTSRAYEACESTADCAGGLACSGTTHTCIPAKLEITPNNKECASVQCTTPNDCCTAVWTEDFTCVSARQYCSTDATTYASYCTTANGPDCVCSASRYACENDRCRSIECQAPADCCAGWVEPSSCVTARSYCSSDPTLYASYCTTANGPTCTCNAANFDCVLNVCVAIQACTTDSNCTSAAPRCLNGRCMQCVADSDCSSTQACISNACRTPQCEIHGDCPAFYECQADKTCKRVGCKTNRECMAYLDSYLATCDTAATPYPNCVTTCQRDSDCSSETNPLGLCVGGKCVDPGCETEDECKIRLGTQMNGFHAVCRDKTTP